MTGWLDGTTVLGEVRAGGLAVGLEVKPADLWVGAYTAPKDGARHWWVCPVPAVVIHARREREGGPMCLNDELVCEELFAVKAEERETERALFCLALAVMILALSATARALRGRR